MPRNEVLELRANELVELTLNDVTAITIEPLLSEIRIYAMPSSTPPANLANGVSCAIGEMLLSDITLATIAPGITPVRVFGYSVVPNRVRVSHG